jgi:hypothetical protein
MLFVKAMLQGIGVVSEICGEASEFFSEDIRVQGCFVGIFD